MANERTEKQKVHEITDKLEEGLKELFESEKHESYLPQKKIGIFFFFNIKEVIKHTHV